MVIEKMLKEFKVKNIYIFFINLWYEIETVYLIWGGLVLRTRASKVAQLLGKKAMKNLVTY